MHRFFLLLTFLALCLQSIAQTQWSPADEFIRSILINQTPKTAQDFSRIRDSLNRISPNNSCNFELADACMAMSQFIRTGYELTPERIADFDVSDSCLNLSARYHFQIGALQYSLKNWQHAIDEFETAVALPGDSGFKADTHNNLSACHDKIQPLSDSVLHHLEAAIRYTDSSQSPYILNNLAALSLKRMEWDRADGFVQKALTYPNLSLNVKFNLHLNALTIALHKGNWNEAKLSFDELQVLPVTAGNECDFVRLSASYLLLCSEYVEYKRNYVWLQNQINKCTESQLNELRSESLLFQPFRSSVDAADSLTTPLTEREWALLKWTYKRNSGQPQEVAKTSTPDPITPIRSRSEAFQEWGLWLVSFWGLISGFILFRRRKNLAKSVNKRLMQRQLRQFRKKLNKGMTPEEIHVELDGWERDWLDPTHISRHLSNPHLHELTTLEEQVLEMLATGRSSKEIAQILEISSSYVYNLRTTIRKKLQVPDHLRLDQWIEGQEIP